MKTNKLTKFLRSLNPFSLENPSVPLSLALSSMGMGALTDSNEAVTEQSALQVPTVLACVRILSEGIASLPLRVYEELPRGRKLAKDHSLYYLLTTRPNPEMSSVDFFGTLAVHAVLWQNAYAEIERDGYGRVIALWPRLPWRTKSVRQNGRLAYETTDTASGASRTLDADNVIHIVGFSLDGWTGTSLISLARQSVGLAMAASRFGARFYANGSRPGGVLELSNNLTPEDMKRLREDFEAMQTGANTHRITVLNPGQKYVPVGIEPVQAQYIETRKFERAEIASTFRVPAYMVGDVEKTLKATVEAQNMEFLTYSLSPWLKRFEQEFQHKLLLNIGRNAGKYSLKFYIGDLVKIDTAAKTASFTAGRTGGWLSVNDVRELDDLPPIEGGDTYLVPLNMVPATSSAIDIESEDEPATGPVTDAPVNPDEIPALEVKSVLFPVFADAINRLQHRAKRDSAAISQALTPVIESLRVSLNSGLAGSEVTKAVSKYLAGVEVRSQTWANEPTTAPDEWQRLLRSLVFATERDKADERARKALNE